MSRETFSFIESLTKDFSFYCRVALALVLLHYVKREAETLLFVVCRP